MENFLYVAAVILVLNVLVGMFRVARGPSVRDRVTGLALLSTTGAAVLIVVAGAMNEASLRTTATVLVALALVIVVVLVSRDSVDE